MTRTSNIVNSIGQNFLTFLRCPRAFAIGTVFAVDSITFSSWVAHIPAIKADLGLSEGELGLALFGAPLGVLVMNPLTGWIINKIGVRPAIFLSALALMFSIQVPIWANSYWSLFGGLFLAGVTNALLNVAMNTSVTFVERQDSVTIMSTCHGMWSLGGVLGALTASVLLWFGISRYVHMGVVAGVMALIMLVLWRTIGTIEEEKSSSGSSLVFPTMTLWLMIFIGLVVSIGEGMAMDWSAVYLKEETGAQAWVAALGFAAFAAAMTVGRFSGDALIAHFGANRLLQLGGVVAAAGLLMAVLLPFPVTSLLGFFLLGLGSSLGAPILYAASMRLPGVPPAAGLATFASLSMVGFLAGPPLIGKLAEAVDLPFSFAVVAVLLVLGTVVTRYALRGKL